MCKIFNLLRTLIFIFRNYPFAHFFYIVFDFYRMYSHKGILIGEYHDFQMDKRSKDFRDSFLGLNEQRYYLDLLNPKKYYILARNKYLTHMMLGHLGIPKSELYCYYQPESKISDAMDIAYDLTSLFHILKSKNVGQCVIKTTESSHGENVLVINEIIYHVNNAELVRHDGHRLLLSSILKDEPLIFESQIKQTAQFSSFNESSVNTVRFMTALYPDKSVKIIATFIKIGRSGKCVDNAGDGGNVDLCIDVRSGKTQYAIQFDGWEEIKEIDAHPDNGHQLNGVTIDNWEGIKKEVMRFQQAFPYCKLAGWDIAITDQGPVVIEVNDFWDRTGQYFIRSGWRNEVRDCYLAWKKTGSEYSFERQNNVLSNSHLKRIYERE